MWQQQRCTSPYGLPAGGFPDPARRAGHYRDGAKLWARTHASAAGCASGQQLRAGRTGKGGAGRRVSAFDYRFGGSANDGGIGFASALGARFWRKDGTLPARGRSGPAHIQRIDLSGLTRVYSKANTGLPAMSLTSAWRAWRHRCMGRRKADEAALSELEAGMAHYSQPLTQTLDLTSQRARRRGRGRYGAALIAYTGATLRPGIDGAELLNADDHLRDAALTIGEGWLDRQSAFGKAPVGVVQTMACRVPVVAFAAGDESSRQLYQHHIDAMWSFASALWRWQSR
ncbi:hypothetical protein EAO17_27540 [Klebsiella pneumoniae]|uniref:Uncharacterized protein n=1 Tax=Klebsiella pneumoniae TaxID=573 RepID=A0ABD7JJT6_KLEPN|nr:hypothetical protein EAO17_27540 [Klebsiella pneumoniae]